MDTPSQFYGDSIFWIETEKIKPNPYQPRRDFDEARLKDLADSIRMYGVLQPLVVTRREYAKDDGGLGVEYELISGERRLRASKLAGIPQVPAIIRSDSDDARVKLELAIIENLQREDLNPVDRARAFQRLVDEFSFKHAEIAAKVGKSREYVSNTLRIMALPADIIQALAEGRITEGHTRPLLMLIDRPEEQMTLFKEVVYKKITVREAEIIARKVAFDKIRKKERAFDPSLVEIEEKLAESLGTRVHIERKENGGKISIDFFSDADLQAILDLVASNKKRRVDDLLNNFIAGKVQGNPPAEVAPAGAPATPAETGVVGAEVMREEAAEPAITHAAPPRGDDPDDDLYSVRNFSI